MATALHNVRRNFVYQLGQITPTATSISRGFEVVDRLRLRADEGNQSGRARDFTIVRLRADEDMEPTDMSQREAWHEYDLRIYYPTALGLEQDLDDIIEQDRHDVIERLRDSQYRVGIAGASSQSVGLLHRFRTFDELDDDGEVWSLTLRWRCLIRETV